MITKQDIINESKKYGFEDIGFTTAEPFESHRDFLTENSEVYDWLAPWLLKGYDPRSFLPGAKSIIVLMEIYFREGYPHPMEKHFGRCYLDDDRQTKDGLALRIKGFRSFLRDNGIDSKLPFNSPHRMAAARSGLGTFGKNCLFYTGRTARQSSWNLPIALIIDREFEPDEPSIEMGCPSWCRNACISACPTRALTGPCRIDPRRCVSYLTYYGDELTPRELREPMGLYVYGCDQCQNVCPRNHPWLASDLPLNRKVVVKAPDFELTKLLHMDREYYEKKIWPHMFYISPENIWKWKMNVARVMGNTLDPLSVPELVRAFRENDDERVRGMCAWALGRIGGEEARSALKDFLKESMGSVREEIELALN